MKSMNIKVDSVVVRLHSCLINFTTPKQLEFRLSNATGNLREQETKCLTIILQLLRCRRQKCYTRISARTTEIRNNPFSVITIARFEIKTDIKTRGV